MAEATVNTPPLRILHLNSLLNGGGTDDQCIKLAKALGDLGQDVWLAGPDGKELSKAVRHLGIRLLPTESQGPLKLRFILRAAKWVRHERIQIVHGHHGRDLWPAVLAARLSGVRPKVVLTRHLAKSPGSWVSRRFLLNRCDTVIAVSNFVARVLSEGVHEPESLEPERRARAPMRGDHSRIEVIHGGIDTERFHPFDATEQRLAWGLAPEHYAFAVVGGYDLPRGKGQREFLRAAATVHERIPGARFLLVGRGTMKQMLQEDIERLGLRDRAWLTPYSHDPAMAMNAIDCLVHPQVGTEAFPGVVLEAFACGRPVIASRLDGIPEAFAAGDLGRLVTPESIPELAQAIVDMVRAPRLTQEECARLHGRVRHGFSVEVCAKKTLALYHQLLAMASG
jgi:glycosyltransferase involved in cell wall biosynthesis